MVHSGTGRLQEERKELARSCKEKICEIRRDWRLFVNDSRETDTKCVSLHFVSLLHFHTNSWCAFFFVLRCFQESHWRDFHEQTDYDFPGLSIITLAFVRLAKKETYLSVGSAEHNLELSVLEWVCTQYSSYWYVFEVDLCLSRNCWN